MNPILNQCSSFLPLQNFKKLCMWLPKILSIGTLGQNGLRGWTCPLELPMHQNSSLTIPSRPTPLQLLLDPSHQFMHYLQKCHPFQCIATFLPLCDFNLKCRHPHPFCSISPNYYWRLENTDQLSDLWNFLISGILIFNLATTISH